MSESKTKRMTYYVSLSPGWENSEIPPTIWSYPIPNFLSGTRFEIHFDLPIIEAQAIEAKVEEVKR